MKIFPKRIPKGNVLLFLSFSAISLCLLLIVSASRAGRENSLMRNNLYSGHQKNFYIAGTEEKGQWQEVIPALAASGEDFGLYVSVPSEEIPIRGVCVQGGVNQPPMVEGGFFDFATSWTDSPKMVLGKAFRKQAALRGGSLYYQLEGITFEVIGIMGTKEDSRANHMILIDFQSAVKLSGINAEYKLDTKSRDSIRGVGQELCRLFGGSANVLMTLGEEREEPLLTRLFSSDAVMDTMYVMVLVSFSLSTILVTFIWLRFRRQLFFAWALCGAGRRWECLEVFWRYLCVAGTAFFVGILMILPLSAVLPEIRISAQDVFLALGITLGLGTGILFSCYGYDRRKV